MSLASVVSGNTDKLVQAIDYAISAGGTAFADDVVLAGVPWGRGLCLLVFGLLRLG